MIKNFKQTAKRIANSLGFEIHRIDTNLELKNPVEAIHKIVPEWNRPLICDVGANEGQSIRKILKTFPHADIHTFEPNPRAYKQLQGSFRSLPNVHPWRFGVGSKNQESEFFENENSDMSSFLEGGEAHWGSVVRTTKVDVVSLDAFTSQKGIQKVDLLKVDTQGYELEVFEGARNLMQRDAIGFILFEVCFAEIYKNAPSFDELFRYLTEKRFQLVNIFEMHLIGSLAGWCDILMMNRASIGQGTATKP